MTEPRIPRTWTKPKPAAKPRAPDLRPETREAAEAAQREAADNLAEALKRMRRLPRGEA